MRDAIEATKGQVGIDGYDPERQTKQKSSVRLRIGTDDDNHPIFASAPVTIHRAIPEDAEIAWAHLTRRRIGTHDRYHVNFTLQRQRGWEKPGLADRGDVGIDVGWRLVPGGLRVAYWVGDDGRKGELVLPQKLLDGMHYPDQIQSERDQTYNAIKPALHEWLSKKWGTLPEWLLSRAAAPDKYDAEALPKCPTVARWKSQGKYTRELKCGDAGTRRNSIKLHTGGIGTLRHGGKSIAFSPPLCGAIMPDALSRKSTGRR